MKGAVRNFQKHEGIVVAVILIQTIGTMSCIDGAQVTLRPVNFIRTVQCFGGNLLLRVVMRGPSTHETL